MIYDDLQLTWSSCTQLIFQFSFSRHLSLFNFFAAHERERRRQCVTRQSTPDSINTDVPFILFTREKYSRNSERLIPSMCNMAAQITFNNFFFSLQLSPTTYFVKLFNQSCHSIVSVILKILVSCFTETFCFFSIHAIFPSHQDKTAPPYKKKKNKQKQKHRISQIPKQGLCQRIFKNTFLRSVGFVDCLLVAAAPLQRKKLNPHPIQDT